MNARITQVVFDPRTVHNAPLKPHVVQIFAENGSLKKIDHAPLPSGPKDWRFDVDPIHQATLPNFSEGDYVLHIKGFGAGRMRTVAFEASPVDAPENSEPVGDVSLEDLVLEIMARQVVERNRLSALEKAWLLHAGDATQEEMDFFFNEITCGPGIIAAQRTAASGFIAYCLEDHVQAAPAFYDKLRDCVINAFGRESHLMCVTLTPYFVPGTTYPKISAAYPEMSSVPAPARLQ